MAATTRDLPAADPAAPPETPRAHDPAAPSPAARTGRVHAGELISAGSALALLVILFATPWYGVAGVPDPSAARPAISGTETGWEGLSVVRWVILATVVAAIGSVFLHASQRGHGSRTETGWPVLGLGALTSLLLIYRVLIALPSPQKVIDQKLGAVLGLACALGIVLGAHESVLEQRERSRDSTVRRRPRRRDRRGGEDREASLGASDPDPDAGGES